MKQQKHPAVGRIIIIETDGHASADKASGEVHGLFKTMADAEAWMIADAAATFSNSDHSFQDGDAKDWGSDMYVCEVKRVCRPVPVVSITARVDEVSRDNTAG